jgi:hypothetical protein
MNYNHFGIWFVGLLCILIYNGLAFYDLVPFSTAFYNFAMAYGIGGFIYLCIK